MRRYLVIANQTLAEGTLMDAIRERLKAGPSAFYVLVPNTGSRDLAARVASRVPLPPTVGEPTTDAEATDNARQRLAQIRKELGDLGADAGGELGDPDPLEAASQLLERREFDEIILSTLPQPVSRWLGMDLPRRLQRRFDLPVTTITARA
jgi:hypothetical protein